MYIHTRTKYTYRGEKHVKKGKKFWIYPKKHNDVDEKREFFFQFRLLRTRTDVEHACWSGLARSVGLCIENINLSNSSRSLITTDVVVRGICGGTRQNNEQLVTRFLHSRYNNIISLIARTNTRRLPHSRCVIPSVRR